MSFGPLSRRIIGCKKQVSGHKVVGDHLLIFQCQSCPKKHFMLEQRVVFKFSCLRERPNSWLEKEQSGASNWKLERRKKARQKAYCWIRSKNGLSWEQITKEFDFLRQIIYKDEGKNEIDQGKKLSWEEEKGTRQGLVLENYHVGLYHAWTSSTGSCSST